MAQKVTHHCKPEEVDWHRNNDGTNGATAYREVTAQRGCKKTDGVFQCAGCQCMPYDGEISRGNKTEVCRGVMSVGNEGEAEGNG